MKSLIPIIIVILLNSCNLKPSKSNKTISIHDLPKKENFWIFFMTGQSNMAGRGNIEPIDTISNPRILSIDNNNNWIIAKEPIHFYEPSMTGLDCGLSFGKELISQLNDSIYIGLIPCAVGGSNITQWLGDSLHRGVKLYSNFKEKVEFASSVGSIKGILWHQGETNANSSRIHNYSNNLKELFLRFRNTVSIDDLPILCGELGSFIQSEDNISYTDSINKILHNLSMEDENIHIIQTNDLNHRGDFLHFNSESQRLLDKRFARNAILTLVNQNKTQVRSDEK